MAQARKKQICLSETPYYHCVSRCVRQSFLCGENKFTGQNYEHRRGWVESRLLFLGSVFAIDIAAFAVMNNHTHVVLFVDKDLAGSFSKKEVLTRWHKLHRGTLLTQKYLNGKKLNKCEALTVDKITEVYRKRLFDISWFMRSLNEYIAREANKEDECTGRFWEGRFKSQALLDERALLACMAYVDLNPIRARMESTPETSRHTSIFKRIAAMKTGKQPKSLLRFVGNHRQNTPKGITFSLSDYCELVDCTGRIERDDKLGFIGNRKNKPLERLGINLQQWFTLATEFERHFSIAAGSEHMLQKFKRSTNHQRIRGMGKAKLLLNPIYRQGN
ncbi:transposase [Aliiglaciecola sp. SL4]|uniref:transposase n=1 Tax=Aliiglaciecola sp. SL4 TaxID=3239806 RepID=UPI00355C6E0E